MSWKCKWTISGSERATAWDSSVTLLQPSGEIDPAANGVQVGVVALALHAVYGIMAKRRVPLASCSISSNYYNGNTTDMDTLDLGH